VPKQSERLHRRIHHHAARRSSKQVCWTNPSVNAISCDEDSISVIAKNANDLVFIAKDDGRPDLYPFCCAKSLHLAVRPRDDIADERLKPESSTRAGIKLNPNQAEARVRFSLAHEIHDFGLTIPPQNVKRDSSDGARKIQTMVFEEQSHRKRRR
jgi:hypothetical protein